MNVGKKYSLIKIVWVVVLIVVMAGNLGYGYIHQNHTNGAYEEPDGTSSLTGPCSIRYYTEIGAAYYLKANTAFQSLLRIVELQDIESVDYGELQRLVNEVLENMNGAVEAYDLLIAKAEYTPYNPDVLELLKEFDYDSFRIENHLNREIFDMVEDYLRFGNVTGGFRFTHSTFLEILQQLEPVKASIEQSKIPNTSFLWNINETFASSSLFGSYVSRIFYKILK
jgi:hypothetical protein